MCHECSSTSTGGPEALQPMTKPLEGARDYAKLDRALNSLERHRMSWPFKKEPDTDKLPVYRSIVKNHMGAYCFFMVANVIQLVDGMRARMP